MQYIDATGLTRLFKVLDMEVDHTLITALIEWWRSKMHTVLNLNKSILAGARIRYKWLDARFAAPPAADAGDEVEQQHARYHQLVWMGALLFMDKLADRVSLLLLQFLNPISNVR